MAVIACGPVFAGGFETVTVTEGGERYRMWYLPDLNNDELQQRGESPVYYWVPNQVRLARQGDTRDFKFHLLHFVDPLAPDHRPGNTAWSDPGGSGHLSQRRRRAADLAD